MAGETQELIQYHPDMGRIPVLSLIEDRLTRGAKPRWLPLFILGPARSGTTLIYQCITQAFEVSYFSNAMTRWHRCPAMAARLLAWCGGFNPPAVFQSVRGRIAGWNSPAQGHEIWNRWFPRKNDTTELLNWSAPELQSLIGSVAAVESACNAPFVNKWPGHSIHLPQLHKAFPQALYLRIRRDELRTAQSVLRMRQDLGDASRSVSRVPADFEPWRNRSPIEQVCAYVRSVNRTLDRDLKLIAPDRCLEWRYETFCDQPRAAMAELQAWRQRLAGRPLRTRRLIPERFAPSEGRSSPETPLLARCLSTMNKQGEP